MGVCGQGSGRLPPPESCTAGSDRTLTTWCGSLVLHGDSFDVGPTVPHGTAALATVVTAALLQEAASSSQHRAPACSKFTAVTAVGCRQVQPARMACHAFWCRSQLPVTLVRHAACPIALHMCCRFRGDAGLVLLQKGGPLVIRRLCAAMGPEVVFREFASILDAELDLSFASTMVQVRGCRALKQQHRNS